MAEIEKYKNSQLLRLIWKRILKPHERVSLIALSGAQVVLTLLDLTGIVLIGLLGNLTITGIESSGTQKATSVILNLLGLTHMTFQKQVMFLGLVSGTILTAKTLLSVLISKKSFNILALISARNSVETLERIIQLPTNELVKRTKLSYIYDLTEGIRALTIGILGSSISLLSDFSLLIISITSLFIYDYRIASGLIIFMATLTAALHLFLGKVAASAGRENSRKSLESNEKISEAISLIWDIKNKNAYKNQVEEFRQVRLSFAKSLATLAFLPYVGKYVIETAILVGTLTLFAIQFYVFDASTAVLNLSIMLALGFRLAPAVLRIQQSFLIIKSSKSVGKSYVELLDKIHLSKIVIEQVNECTFCNEYGIILENVSFQYSDDNNYTLNNISVEVKFGEFIAIVGPTGAGKSTFLEVLMGMVKPTDGKVTIAKHEAHEFAMAHPNHLAFVPQNIEIINGTVRENLVFGLKDDSISDSEIYEVLSQSQLTEFVSGLESKLETLLGSKGQQLSGGQLQRLGIARALLCKPSILVLDEATSALDPLTEHFITECLNRMKSKITIIVVAHRLTTIKDASKIYYMDQGRILGNGTFSELRSKIANFDQQVNLVTLNRDESIGS